MGNPPPRQTDKNWDWTLDWTDARPAQTQMHQGIWGSGQMHGQDRFRRDETQGQRGI